MNQHKELNFAPEQAYRDWFDKYRAKISRQSIFSKGAVIWNAALANQAADAVPVAWKYRTINSENPWRVSLNEQWARSLGDMEVVPLYAHPSPTTAPASESGLEAQIRAMRCKNPYSEDNCNLYGEGYAVARQEAAELAQVAASKPAEPDGSWLWGKLMDWCRQRRVPPASYDDLFAIAGEAHRINAAKPETITLAEIWEAANGNPDVNPNKELLLNAIRSIAPSQAPALPATGEALTDALGRIDGELSRALGCTDINKADRFVMKARNIIAALKGGAK